MNRFRRAIAKVLEPHYSEELPVPMMPCEWHAQQARNELRQAELATTIPAANAHSAQSVAHSNLAIFERMVRDDALPMPRSGKELEGVPLADSVVT